MPLRFRKLHPSFAAEVTGVDLRKVEDQTTLNELRRAMDEYGVLVFPGQDFTDPEQSAFARRFDPGDESRADGDGGEYGQPRPGSGRAVSEMERRLSLDLVKVSNLDDSSKIVEANDPRRVSKLGNRMWHTDGSIVNPSGRYTMLSGRVIPPVRADTQFADTRGAYDTLDDETKAGIDKLTVHYSLVYARHLMGFVFSPEEERALPGAVHPLVRINPHTGRRSLYIGQHAARVIEMPIPEGRLLLGDLTEHATQREFVYSHEWRQHDFLIWDNRATLHRARPFDDAKYGRDMRRTVTRDIGSPIVETA